MAVRLRGVRCSVRVPLADNRAAADAPDVIGTSDLRSPPRTEKPNRRAFALAAIGANGIRFHLRLGMTSPKGLGPGVSSRLGTPTLPIAIQGQGPRETRTSKARTGPRAGYA